MLSQGHGKIINTASMASLLVPHPQKQAAYNASKAAGEPATATMPEGACFKQAVTDAVAHQ